MAKLSSTVVEPPNSGALASLVPYCRARRLVLAASLFMFIFCATRGTWNLALERVGAGNASRFFLAQAESLWHGDLAVRPSDIPAECYLRNGTCFGYYGITPSVLRLPFLALLHTAQSSMTPAFITAAAMLATWSACALVDRAWVRILAIAAPLDIFSRRSCVVVYAALLVCLGPGSILLVLTRPAVYEEALLWAIAFSLLSVRAMIVWSDGGGRRAVSVAIIAAMLAANSRPTAAVPPLVVGCWLMWRSWRSAGLDARRSRLRSLALIGLAASLPLVSLSAVYFAKFRTPVPDLVLNEQVPENASWAHILEVNGHRTVGLGFAPTAAVAYLRPSSLTLHGSFPFARFRYPSEEDITWVPPLAQGGAYVEPVASVVDTMPVLTAVTLLGVVASIVRRVIRRRCRLEQLPVSTSAALFIGCSAAILMTVSNVAITNRYLGDFYPALVVGTMMGIRPLLVITQRSRARAVAVAASLSAVALLSVAVAASLTYQIGW